MPLTVEVLVLVVLTDTDLVLPEATVLPEAMFLPPLLAVAALPLPATLAVGVVVLVLVVLTDTDLVLFEFFVLFEPRVRVLPLA